MRVPDELFPVLQNGGIGIMFVFIFVVVVFAPLIYIAVLGKGKSESRLVSVIDAFTRFVAATRKPRK